jgi:hypothetical protein
MWKIHEDRELSKDEAIVFGDQIRNKKRPDKLQAAGEITGSPVTSRGGLKRYLFRLALNRSRDTLSVARSQHKRLQNQQVQRTL